MEQKRKRSSDENQGKLSEYHPVLDVITSESCKQLLSSELSAKMCQLNTHYFKRMITFKSNDRDTMKWVFMSKDLTLLQQQIDCGALDESFAMEYAAKYGSVDMMKTLRNAQIEFDDFTLHEAIEGGNMVNVEWLLTEQCPLHYSALCVALTKKLYELCERLLSLGLQITQNCFFSVHESDEAIRWLLTHGGIIPLDVVGMLIANDRVEIVKYILSLDPAETHIRTRHLINRAFSVSVFSEKHELCAEICRLRIAARPDESRDYLTCAMYVAIRADDFDFVKMLYEWGCPLCCSYVSAAQYNEEIRNWLLVNGCPCPSGLKWLLNFIPTMRGRMCVECSCHLCTPRTVT